VNDAKYIGLDVHQATISAAVLDSTGKLVMECRSPHPGAQDCLHHFDRLEERSSFRR